MKNKSPIEDFLDEERIIARKLITDAVNEHYSNSEILSRKFDFNRFKVTLDFVSNTILIEDDLNPSSTGESSLPIDEFLSKLNSD